MRNPSYQGKTFLMESKRELLKYSMGLLHVDIIEL
jgi:hypothetical protein